MKKKKKPKTFPQTTPCLITSITTTGNQETAAASNGFEATRSIQMIDHHVIVKNDPARRRPIGRSAIGGRASSLSDSTSEASSLSRNNNAKIYTTAAVDLGNKQYPLRISQSPPSLSPINLSSPTSSPPFATTPLPSQSRSSDLQQNTFASQQSRYHIPPIYNQAPPSIRAIGQQIAHINTQAQDDIGIPTPPASSDPIDMESVYKRKIPSVMGKQIIFTVM